MTLYLPTPNKSAIQTALGNFLTSILPAGTPIVVGQDNRVPEPAAADFVVFTEMFQRRLSANLDSFVDCQFTASITGSTMDVTAVKFGTITVGNMVFGVGVASGTLIQAQGTGRGGVGSYTLSNSQNVLSEKMAAGVAEIEQDQETSFQIDVHGPNSADNAVTISTLFRDEFATRSFGNFATAAITPLYADDPKQIPFINAEEQYENRWVVTACLECNQIVAVPQEFADQIVITLIDVDAEYPAT